MAGLRHPAWLPLLLLLLPPSALALLLRPPLPGPPVLPRGRPRAPTMQLDDDGGLLEAPRDELKTRFTRGDDGDTSLASFAPSADAPSPQADAEADAPGAPSPNAALLAEIRALQPEPLPPKPERKAVDLNGIKPAFLLLGALSYGACSVLAWQFTNGAAEYFDANQSESAFYVVNRLSSIARVVVIAMGALGTGVCGIAGAGQLALAAQVQMGIAKGELDPNAQRDDPYGGRKQGELEKMLGLMMGDKDAGGGE